MALLSNCREFGIFQTDQCRQRCKVSNLHHVCRWSPHYGACLLRYQYSEGQVISKNAACHYVRETVDKPTRQRP